MTLLVMLRHAQTQWSQEKRLQGRTDVPLNEAGRLAMRAVRIPAHLGQLQVASSPLLRCVQTAACLGLQGMRTEPRLTEMSWGEWEGRSLAELRAELGEAMRANESRGMDFLPPQGESPRMVWARVRPWLAGLARVGAPTLAISHRGVIRVVFAAAIGWDLLGRPPVKLDWSYLQVFRLDPRGDPAVVRLNLPLEPALAPASAERGG